MGIAEKAIAVEDELEQKGIPTILAQRIATWYALLEVEKNLGAVHTELLEEPPCLALSENFLCVDVDYVYAYRLPGLIDADDHIDDTNGGFLCHCPQCERSRAHSQPPPIFPAPLISQVIGRIHDYSILDSLLS